MAALDSPGRSCYFIPMADKATLRKSILDRRKGLESERVTGVSLAVTELIRALPEWKSAREVLLYWPIQNEIDTRPLMTELWSRGVKTLFPRCQPGQPGVMELACANCHDDLEPGMYSIMEPDATACPVEENANPDIALIPGVAYDRRGYRLGFGGGYYDRLLAKPGLLDTLTIGLCYEFQLLDALPVEEWDQPVSAICTEESLWRP